ncbi:MAG: BamA/TamA family outer membrane protein, partial [Candidatus Heimdallarchaeota archaeon]|nr:BamA/TamA family outer membrane protein [Candidatus Heimdallarchaeota archaeon]
SVDKMATQLYALTEQKKSEKSVLLYDYSKFEISPAAYSEKIKKSFRLNAENKNTITLEMIKNDLDIIYSSGSYKSVQASMLASRNDSILVYSLNVTDVITGAEFEGSTLFADSVIQNLLKYRSGFPLNMNHISKGLSEIKGMYRNQGYALIRFKEIDFNPTSGLLKVHLDEGTIGDIGIEGNEISEEIIILREFPLSKNDIYNSRLVKEGIDNIYNTQLFDKVSVNVDIRDGKNILNIKVLEKKHVVLRLGGKVGSERGAQLYAEWANENFLGNAYQLYLSARYGEHDRRIGLNYRVDQVFETLLTTSFKVFYDWKRFPFIVGDEEKGEYLEIRRGAKFGIGLQLQKLGQISIEMRLENVKDSPYSGNLTEAQQERVSQKSELRTLSVKSVTDNRDNIAFTTNGIYNVWFWETANQQIVRGQEKYTKAFVNLEGFYTYWMRHTFHFRGLIGIGDKTLPFSEWFRIGGLHDFIGLHDSEYFGRQVILANLEYRFLLPFEIISDVYLAFRYDIGAIWETADLVLESEDFFTGIGGWLGINTLLGPLYFGYGDTSNKTGIFYISLGYNF